MSKEFINEVSRMKDLFGYKKGKVISEQDFKPFDPNGSYPSLGIGNKSNLTPKQIEAAAAGWGPVTDETAKSLKVGPDGKILPKQVGTTTDEFSKFPCVKSLKTEKKATAKATGVPMKIGEGNLKQYYFGADGTLYSYGQEYGKWSCGSKPNTVLINGKEVSVEVKPVTPTTQTLPNGTVLAIPKSLKDKEGVKKFQDWMDINHPNWVKGKNLNKGGGYGKFGPSTSAAWNKYKDEYLGGSKTTDTPDYPVNKLMTGTKDYPGAFNKKPGTFDDIEPPTED
jgi:hypothetical protein